MKRKLKKMVLFSLILLLMMTLTGITVEARLIPKVTNFVILIDQSGSMFQKHATLKKVKATLAKDILLQMNQRIPELGYNAALQVFAPDETLIGPEKYDRESYKELIVKLPIEGEIFGNLTPLGPAVSHLDKVINQFTGKTAIIIVSDGKANQGEAPLKAAQEFFKKYPNICFDIISLADNDKGRKNLQNISQVDSCTYAEGSDLLSDPAELERFINEVFYLEVSDEVPVQAVSLSVAVQEGTQGTITLQDVLFDFDKYNIKSEWEPVLIQNLKVLLDSDASFEIEGHTDWDGPEAYNQKLSERRAKAVFDYLRNKGIAADRMKTVGFGESMPKISNLTPEGRAINRRVEIQIIK